MSQRQNDILQTLASLLEKHPQNKISTALLAKTAGVSEAALYRHFPSKRRMFEELYQFAEDVLFSRISSISHSEQTRIQQCEQIARLLLTFAKRNSGISRILVGINLDDVSLQERANQILNRIETEIKQLISKSELEENRRYKSSSKQIATLIMVTVEGILCRFVRSNFAIDPCEQWTHQWALLEQIVEE